MAALKPKEDVIARAMRAREHGFLEEFITHTIHRDDNLRPLLVKLIEENARLTEENNKAHSLTKEWLKYRDYGDHDIDTDSIHFNWLMNEGAKFLYRKAHLGTLLVTRKHMDFPEVQIEKGIRLAENSTRAANMDFVTHHCPEEDKELRDAYELGVARLAWEVFWLLPDRVRQDAHIMNGPTGALLIEDGEERYSDSAEYDPGSDSVTMFDVRAVNIKAGDFEPNAFDEAILSGEMDDIARKVSERVTDILTADEKPVHMALYCLSAANAHPAFSGKEGDLCRSVRLRYWKASKETEHDE